jgi:hypothetical protein
MEVSWRLLALPLTGIVNSPTPFAPQPAAEREVVPLDENTAVILVIGVATFLVALVGLVIKLIELGRK